MQTTVCAALLWSNSVPGQCSQVTVLKWHHSLWALRGTGPSPSRSASIRGSSLPANALGTCSTRLLPPTLHANTWTRFLFQTGLLHPPRPKRVTLQAIYSRVFVLSLRVHNPIYQVYPKCSKVKWQHPYLLLTDNLKIKIVCTDASRLIIMAFERELAAYQEIQIQEILHCWCQSGGMVEGDLILIEIV